MARVWRSPRLTWLASAKTTGAWIEQGDLFVMGRGRIGTGNVQQNLL